MTRVRITRVWRWFCKHDIALFGRDGSGEVVDYLKGTAVRVQFGNCSRCGTRLQMTVKMTVKELEKDNAERKRLLEEAQR